MHSSPTRSHFGESAFATIAVPTFPSSSALMGTADRLPWSAVLLNRLAGRIEMETQMDSQSQDGSIRDDHSTPPDRRGNLCTDDVAEQRVIVGDEVLAAPTRHTEIEKRLAIVEDIAQVSHL